MVELCVLAVFNPVFGMMHPLLDHPFGWDGSRLVENPFEVFSTSSIFFGPQMGQDRIAKSMLTADLTGELF